MCVKRGVYSLCPCDPMTMLLWKTDYYIVCIVYSGSCETCVFDRREREKRATWREEKFEAEKEWLPIEEEGLDTEEKREEKTRELAMQQREEFLGNQPITYYASQLLCVSLFNCCVTSETDCGH